MAVLDAHRYLVWFGLTVVALLASVAGCNVLVDPYYVFGMPARVGPATIKPRADREQILAKSALLAHEPCPRTLVMGNSRPEVGLDPASAAWPTVARPVFNGAIAGTGPSTMTELLESLPTSCRPRLVIFAADFADALAPLGPPQRPGLRRRITDLVQVALTLDALDDSLATLWPWRETNGMRRDGFITGNEYSEFVRLHGYTPLFSLKREAYRAQWQHLLRGALPPADSGALRQTRALVRAVRARSAAVTLFVPPYHLQFMALIDELGMAPRYAEWRVALAALARSEGATLFDFAVPSSLTSEPVPHEGDLRPMRNYWELGHFKPALGEQVIARLFGKEGFGVELVPPPTPQIEAGVGLASH